MTAATSCTAAKGSSPACHVKNATIILALMMMMTPMHTLLGYAFFTCFDRQALARTTARLSMSSYLSLDVNEESVASARLPPVATGRQKPAEGNSSELTADDDLDLDLDLDFM